MKKWIALIVVVLLALGTFVIAGPYLAINGIRTALSLTQDSCNTEFV